LIEFLIYNSDIDWGTFINPSPITLDLGAL
jgi:hypothetical protein